LAFKIILDEFKRSAKQWCATCQEAPNSCALCPSAIHSVHTIVTTPAVCKGAVCNACMS
jgi:hypothetical protein